MEFKKLPSNSKKLLDEILQADNSVQMLCERFESASRKEDEELRGILKELREEGLVNVSWASNKPYCVNISNSARTYNERLAEYEAMMLGGELPFDVYKEAGFPGDDGADYDSAVVDDEGRTLVDWD